MHLDNCTTFGCPQTATHAVLILEDGYEITYPFCGDHVYEYQNQSVQGDYKVVLISQIKEKQMAETPPPAAPMAPPDAVYDETNPPSTEECSTNFFWEFGNTEHFKLQTTVRGAPSEEQLKIHIQAAINQMKAVIQVGGHAPGTQAYSTTASPTTQAPKQPSPTATPTTAPAATPPPAATTSPTSTTPAPIASPTSTSPPEAQKEQHQFVCHELHVKPRTDGIKVDIAFWRRGDRFPMLTETRRIENAPKLLEGTGAWMEDHFKGVAKYELNPPYIVTWENSEQLNSKGNPYKNVVNIQIQRQ